ncbi:MAG: hypothetical protein Q9184_005337 [Pyrenodesmia sp. 2 TL-2023]
MYRYSYALLLAAATSILPTLGLSSPDNFIVGPSATALKPINIHDFEAATGVQRIAAEEFAQLDLSTQAQLIYGRPGDDGQLLLANMTLYAPDGLQMVMMERFEPLTTAVDCNGDDGSMSLTFKSPEAFQHALDTWSFINKDQEEKFLLIANHAGCGPDDERQAYLYVPAAPLSLWSALIKDISITNIQEDQDTLTTFLTAEKAPWSDVAGTYDLDFGKAIPAPKMARRRGLFDSISNAASRVSNAVSNIGNAILNGDVDFSKSISFPVNVGTPGVSTEIVNTTLFKLTCTQCYIAGSFQLTGHLSVADFKLQELTLSGSPQGFNTTMDLSTQITGAPLYSPTSLQYTKELFSVPVPQAGLSVPGIFSIGAVASYGLGVSTTFKGSTSMTFGIAASLPDTAVLTAGYRSGNPSSAGTATGFEGAVFDPNFNLTALAGGVTVAAYAEAKLSFGVDITKWGRVEVEFALQVPKLERSVWGAYNESGLCPDDPGASKTGAQITTDLAAQVNLNLVAKTGSDTTPTVPITLYKHKYPLTSSCLPINIPNLNSSATEPTPATIPTAAAFPAIASGTTETGVLAETTGVLAGRRRRFVVGSGRSERV